MLHNAVRLRNYRPDRAFQFNTEHLLPHLSLCFSRDFCCFCLPFTFRSHFSDCHMSSLYLPFRAYFVFVLSPLRCVLLGQVCCHITDSLQHAMYFLLFLQHFDHKTNHCRKDALHSSQNISFLRAHPHALTCCFSFLTTIIALHFCKLSS